jgi:hypothetical protein
MVCTFRDSQWAKRDKKEANSAEGCGHSVTICGVRLDY